MIWRCKDGTVTTQDIGVNDLRWIIDYRPERCTMCGSCVASCTLNALEVAVMRQDLTVSVRASRNRFGSIWPSRHPAEGEPYRIVCRLRHV